MRQAELSRNYKVLMNDIEDPQIEDNANNASSLLLGHVDLGKSTKNVDQSAKSVCGIESRPQIKRFLDSPQAARPKTIFICGKQEKFLLRVAAV